MLSTWFLVTIFAVMRTFYLAMVEGFLVWGFARVFLPNDISYIKAFIICAVPTFIISLARTARWFKD